LGDSLQGPLPVGVQLDISVLRLRGTRALSTLGSAVIFVFKGELCADNGVGTAVVAEYGHVLLPADPPGATLTGHADVLVMRSRKK
jgi:hypothetical protein